MKTKDTTEKKNHLTIGTKIVFFSVVCVFKLIFCLVSGRGWMMWERGEVTPCTIFLIFLKTTVFSFGPRILAKNNEIPALYHVKLPHNLTQSIAKKQELEEGEKGTKNWRVRSGQK